jgi:Tol biopolymer transport system component
MSPDNGSRVKEVFKAASGRPLEDRARYLDAACSDDVELRAEVESLLLDRDRLSEERADSVEETEFVEETVKGSGQPGSIGRYRIVSLLGEGGMGRVYEAEDPELRRKVALKVLPEAFVDDPKRLERFKREARSVAALSHPNIVTLHSVEEAEGTHFLTMELVQGEPLDRMIPQQGFELGEILGRATQLADGLRAAHDRGIVHRDLKPANVIVDSEDRIRILDFGLAKVQFGTEIESQAATELALTAQGTVLGTAPYMSPEQVAGEDCDHRSDIFSLGSILYEMSTGRRPFPGESSGQVMTAILQQSPSLLTEARPDLPVDLERVIHRCLEKEPAKRYQTAAELREALEVLPVRGAASRRLVRRYFRRLSRVWVLVAVGAGILGIVGIALFTAFFGGRKGGELRQARVVKSVLQQFVDPAGAFSVRLAISPQGDRVAYCISRENKTELYLREFDSFEARLVHTATSLKHPVFSPDGDWVGFLEDLRVFKKLPVNGGSPVTIGTVGNVQGLIWDGGSFVAGSQTSTGGLSEIDAEGATTQLTKPALERGEVSHRYPQVLPGGQAILFTILMADRNSWADGSIAVYDRERGEVRVVLEGGVKARYSATGHLVYASAEKLLAVPFDLETLTVGGTPVPLVDDLHTATGSPNFDLAADGTLVYASGEGKPAEVRLILVDRAGRTQRVLSEGSFSQHPRFAPDGRRIVFARGSFTSDIVVLDLERDTQTPVTFRWLNILPRWTLDGQRIRFQSTRTGIWSSHRRRADGGGEVERVLALDHMADVAVATEQLVVSMEETDGPHGWDLWLRDTAEDEAPRPFVVSPGDDRFPELSPDGRWIAYESNRSGRSEIYLRSLEEEFSEWQVSAGGGRDARWNPAGGELFYFNGEQLFAVSLDTSGKSPTLGETSILFERPIQSGYLGQNYDVSPDGRTFVLAEPGAAASGPSRIVLFQGLDAVLNRTGNLTNVP